MESSPKATNSGPPGDGDAPSSGARRPRLAGAAPKMAPVHKKNRAGAKTLIQTSGPDPNASLDAIRLTVGVIGGTHGVHGELKLKLLTDHPEHLPTLRQVFLGESETATALLGVRFQGDQALIQLEGVETPEAAKRLGGLKVRIAGADAKPLEEGEYFIFQLIGLAAVGPDGAPIGTVTDIMETGAHDVLTITPETGPDLLVPNHPRYVLEIAPERNLIVIDPPVYAS